MKSLWFFQPGKEKWYECSLLDNAFWFSKSAELFYQAWSVVYQIKTNKNEKNRLHCRTLDQVSYVLLWTSIFTQKSSQMEGTNNSAQFYYSGPGFQVLLWSEKEDRFALVGVTGNFWHNQCLDIIPKDFCLYSDLTTWPNLTKFCSLTLAGASPRTPWWTLGCLKTQT